MSDSSPGYSMGDVPRLASPPRKVGEQSTDCPPPSAPGPSGARSKMVRPATSWYRMPDPMSDPIQPVGVVRHPENSSPVEREGGDIISRINNDLFEAQQANNKPHLHLLYCHCCRQQQATLASAVLPLLQAITSHTCICCTATAHPPPTLVSAVLPLLQATTSHTCISCTATVAGIHHPPPTLASAVLPPSVLSSVDVATYLPCSAHLCGQRAMQ